MLGHLVYKYGRAEDARDSGLAEELRLRANRASIRVCGNGGAGRKIARARFEATLLGLGLAMACDRLSSDDANWQLRFSSSD